MILLLNSEGGKHEYSLRPVEFVYRELVGIEKPNEEELTSTYKSLSQKSFPYYESDFLNLICLKAIDLVVEWKGINNHEKTQELNAFVARFEDRTSVISKTIVSILLLILLGGLCYLGYLAYNKPNDKILTLIISLMGLAGISGAALIGKWKQAHRWTTRQVRSFFGYMSK